MVCLVMRVVNHLCVVGLLTLTFARAADCQTVEQYRERTRRLIDLWTEGKVSADSADDVLRANIDIETIRFGELVVFAHPERAFVVGMATRGVWSELAAVLGPDTTLLRGLAFYFPELDRPWGSGPISEGRETKVVRTVDRRPDVLRRRLSASIEVTLSESVDSVFNRWLGAGVPISSNTSTLQDLYEEFLTAPSFLVAECREGDNVACTRALVFVEPGDSIRDWYDAEGRAQLIRGMPGIIRQDREAAAVCLERGWDDVCIAMLQAIPRGAPPPLQPETREAFVRFAIQRGGDGAYRRLLEAAEDTRQLDDVARALETTAGVSMDTLLDEWRTAIMSAKPQQVTFRFRSAFVTIVWIAGLLGLAMRNTRWR